jgi:hypothetical protein
MCLELWRHNHRESNGSGPGVGEIGRRRRRTVREKRTVRETRLDKKT